ncbi:c-type cytochrome [Candidatus Venteria ishoeyi]|uniref:Cytochrome c-552 n=1 Tax=Candidatus Venteria ishoeyi TaxID=1899563 RepID=A0A1H6FIV7_9GAMM|nr:c-type cytochrome [Candidatus Venteria ishoeyi]MDM8547895.1 c-type cytochrome [Candidatus Venteria ishoeyi]SEH08985.1 Cytochrome c-552 precursor [Candidatus Venteria ishoeyi]
MLKYVKTMVLSLLITQAFPAMAFDLDNAEEIHEVCASCHGEFSQGGKQGEYPRLAGLSAEFIAEQLRLFQGRVRQNMPMLPHTEERELPEEDILDISAYITEIKLETKLPLLDETKKIDAFQRLMAAKKILNIARAEGDAKAGEKRYNQECRSCHGNKGWGKETVPMLAGQYTNYLWRQVAKYRKGLRIHDKDEPDEELLKDFTDSELQDIFAYLSIVDDE